jgi:spermidine synthase
MKKTLIQLCSYFWDIPILKTSSPQNDYLELVWSNGKKTLNTKDANFSFGNASKVIARALSPYTHKIQEAQRILILGFGCGSVVELLDQKYNYKNSLVGIEYDATIIELYKDHFAHLFQLKPDIVCSDAAEFLRQDVNQYDIILVDLFKELNNSILLKDPEFLKAIKSHTAVGGIVIFNTISRTETENKQLSSLIIELGMLYKNVSTEIFQDINTIVVAT